MADAGSSDDAESATLTALSDCVTTVLENDIAYGLCVTNSGLFDLLPNDFQDRNSSSSLSFSSSGSSDDNDDFNGDSVCRVMCSEQTSSASASCCAAAASLRACNTSSEAVTTCKQLFDDVFTYQNECDGGISSANTILITVVAIVAVAVAAIAIFARLYKQIKSNFAANVAATWTQVTNLVWKNMILRRRRPVSLLMELFLPVLLSTALLLLANLDNFADTWRSQWFTSEAAQLNANETLICSDLAVWGLEAIGGPSSTMTSFYTGGQSVLGLFFLVSYIKFVSTTTTTMVMEKENRLREVMKIMGLSDATLLCSWCLTTAVLSTPLAFAIAAVLKYGNVFPTTEYATLVFLFWALSVAITAFSYFVAPFFNKSRTAAIASVLLWLILFFPYFAVQSADTNTPRYWAAFSPPTAFALAVDEILRRAQLGTGFAYSVGLREGPVTVPSAFRMSLFLILDSVLLVALGWYLEQVLPQQYGVRKPWYFLLTKSYWVNKIDHSKEDNVETSSENFATPTLSPQAGGVYTQLTDNIAKPSGNAYVEPVNATLAMQERNGTCLQIRGLRKDHEEEEHGADRLLTLERNPKAVAAGAPPITEPSMWTQYWALTKKRFQIAKRDKKTLAYSVGIPLIFLIILAILPEIEVADFIPNYASNLPTEAQQGQCAASANFSSLIDPDFNVSACASSRGFDYCTLGVVNCDVNACCNAANVASPWYPCNTCDSAPCFNNNCLAKNNAKLQVTLNGFLVALVVMLAFAFIPAAIVAFVVREKDPIQNAKSLQLISGANVSAYWLASWTHDVLLTLIPIVASAVVIPLSMTPSGADKASTNDVFAIIALIIAHVWAIIPLAYLFSRRYVKHAVAQTALLVFALGTGGLLSIFSFMCRIVNFTLSGSLTLSSLDRNYLRWLFMVFPGYTLNNGIFELATRKVSRRALFGSGRWMSTSPSFFGLFEGLGKDECVECWDRIEPSCCVRQPFDLEIAGAPLLYTLVEALLLSVLVFVLENRSVKWKQTATKTEHSAVTMETEEEEDDDVQWERHRVEQQEPGPNDLVFIRNLRQQYAGKPRAKVALKDLVEHLKQKFGRGYTVEITLRATDTETEELKSVMDQARAFLSAERSLSVRRSGRTSQRQSSSSLQVNSAGKITTANVQDLCTALGASERGTRILDHSGTGWLLGSQLEAQGSISVETFSSWWVSETHGERLQTFFQTKFPGSILAEQQGEHFRFQVPKHRPDSDAVLRPAEIFRALEQSRTDLNVDEYSVSETALEHIFNNMAAQQDEEKGVAHGMNMEQATTSTD
ncbi:hypothetical protein PC111_g18758 [Phytophthora cactorum]|nr:hypothetical protein PC111_g18758 [Phytophthora cactorum]